MTPSLPPYVDDSEVQLPPTYTSLRLKRVASQNQSIQIPTRYFFLYGFGSPSFFSLRPLFNLVPLSFLQSVLHFGFWASSSLFIRSDTSCPSSSSLAIM